MSERRPTPREDGFSMPAEWEPHEACLMEWPTVTREAFWADRFEEAKRDYATVANAIAAFEPVVMVCDPEQQAEVRRSCGEGVEVLPLPIGPLSRIHESSIFVRDGAASSRTRSRRSPDASCTPTTWRASAAGTCRT